MQFIKSLGPLTQAQERYCVVYANSDVFGIEVE